MGPVELIVIEFEGNRFKGEIIPALRDLVDKDLIHIIDLTFIKKDMEGNVTAFEMTDIEEEIAALFDPILTDTNGMISQEDIMEVSANMQNNSSVGMLVIEYEWARPLREAVINAGGRLVFDTLIPIEVAEEAMKDALAYQARQ